MQKLGKNVNGYRGETIDIRAVLEDCVAAARTCAWAIEEMQAAQGLSLLAFTRTASRANHRAARIYISSGIHGDEPGGPLDARLLLQENQWPASLDLWLCPCLNPTGFALNRRENAEGIDLNRQYLQPRAAETVAHIGWLRSEEHTSELQSRENLVCRLLLEKKKKTNNNRVYTFSYKFQRIEYLLPIFF